MTRNTADRVSVLDWTLNPNEIRRTIGARIRSARLARELSQVEVARRVGITQASLSNYESGKRNLTALNLLAICGVLDVDITTILAVADYEARRAGQGRAA